MNFKLGFYEYIKTPPQFLSIIIDYMKSFFTENKKDPLPLKIEAISKDKTSFKVKELDYDFDGEWELKTEENQANQILNEKILKSSSFNLFFVMKIFFKIAL